MRREGDGGRPGDLDGLPGEDLAAAVDRAADALRALDGASLFVTGGTGFFGRWFLALLARARRTSGSTSPSRC